MSSPGPDATIGFESHNTDNNTDRAPAPDATMGYEAMKAAELAAPAPGSSYGGGGASRPSVVGSVFGKSVMTAAGGRIAPEALIGPYEIIDELGKGGMGVVYKARHVHLNRIVALKMILGGGGLSAAHLERFRVEAEAVAKLNHPNIVQVYDVGEHAGLPYLALELVEGGNLAQKIGGKPQAVRFAAQTVETIARGMQAAHLARVVHRDLKPANVLLTLDGQPKVTDFGLAKDVGEGATGQTHAGSILGTPSYMAPEQAAGRISDIGPGTDVYALGAILYEMLTGHPPFRGESPIATIRMVLDGEPVPPHKLQPNVPRDLDTICLKALQKPVHRRYLTAEDLAEDLRRFLDGEPITARPVGPVERFVKWVRRRPAAAAMLGTGLVAGVAMIALGVWSYLAVTARARDAESAHARASDALAEGTRRLVRLNVANGTRLLDAQDYLGAPLWFAEALRLEPGGADRDRVHRIRLRAVFDFCPRLSNVWLHDAALTDARYAADGTLVLTASEDGTARGWDTATGMPAGPPLEHGGPVKAAAVSADGTTAATGGGDGIVRMWDVKTGKLRAAVSHTSAVTQLAFSPDGKLLLSGGKAGRVRGWDVAAGKELFPAEEFAGEVPAVLFAPAGDRFAAASRDGSARVFDAKTGLPVTPPLKHAGAVRCLAFTPGGKQLLTGSADGTALVWDAATGLPAGPPLRHPAGVSAVAVSPDGKRIITGCDDATAKIWDIKTGLPVGRPATHDGPVLFVAISPDGRWLATGSEDNAARVWDAVTGDPVTPPLRHNATPVAVRFAPNGYELLTADQTRTARVWNLITHGDLAGTAEPAPPPPAAAGRADDVRTVTSPDGSFVATYGGGQAVRVRRAADHESVAAPLRTGAAVTAAAFAPDGKTLATGDQDGNVQVFTTLDGKPVWAAPGRHVSKVLLIVFNPQGTALATTSEDNTARFWNPADGTLTVPPVRVGASVNRAEFGPDGTLFYTELPGGKARIWDAGTGEPITPPFPARADWADTLVVAKWPVEDMLAAGRMLSGQRLTPAGDVIPTDAAALRDDWRGLKEKYPIIAATDSATVGRWLTRQAASAEAANQHFAAAWHLGELIRRNPDSADLRRRRSAAAAQLGDWQQAAADADRAVQTQPDNPDNWFQRGVSRGKLNDWDRAATDFAVAVQLRSDPDSHIGLPAKVKLAAGDRPGYRAACQDLATFHRNTKDPRAAKQVAWACAVGPDSGIDADALRGFAETSADALTQALVHFRLGRTDDALAKLAELPDADPRPAGWALRAAVHAARGQPAAASPWREKLAAWRKGPPPAWDDRADTAALAGPG